jgi:protein TonB
MHTIKTILLLALLCCGKMSFTQTLPPPPADADTVDNKIFLRAEVEASYPGGQQAWVNFLTKTLNSDVPADNSAPAGIFTVVARFIVSKAGTISEVISETYVGYGMDEEVIRTIKLSGNWIPAMQNGRRVNAYRRQPVTFAVMYIDFDVTTKTPYTFYENTDNEMTITVPKVKMEDVEVSISRGTIKQIAGEKYMVRVTGKSRVTIELFNTKKKKTIGTASFEVKQ